MEEEEPVEGPKEVIVIEEGPKINGVVWAFAPLQKLMPWHEATGYLEGTGWRLPTIAELVGVYIYDRGFCRNRFPNYPKYFWTGEIFSNDTYPTCVCLDSGNRGPSKQCHRWRVWPVKEK
jgi:hypothetical protein